MISMHIGAQVSRFVRAAFTGKRHQSAIRSDVTTSPGFGSQQDLLLECRATKASQRTIAQFSRLTRIANAPETCAANVAHQLVVRILVLHVLALDMEL